MRYILLDKICDIRKSIDSKCFLSALALALTIPNICGRVKYKNIVDENSKKYEDKTSYELWFNEYIYEPDRYKGEFEEHYKGSGFDGAACYMLRCDFLHNGSSTIKSGDGRVMINRFELCISGTEDCGVYAGANGIVTNNFGNSTIYHARVDIRALCNSICDASEKFYNEIEDKSLFLDHSIKILNMEQEYEKLKRLGWPKI